MQHHASLVLLQYNNKCTFFSTTQTEINVEINSVRIAVMIPLIHLQLEGIQKRITKVL